MGTILVSGFGAYPGVTRNPSAQVLELLRADPPAAPAPHAFVFTELPVHWSILHNDLPRLHAAHRPIAAVHFGVAPRRRMISIESLARNSASPTSPDAAGLALGRDRLEHGAEERGRGGFAATRLVASLRGAGIPARVSRDAGAYLCNAIYWSSLRAGLRAVFVHLPAPAELPGRRLDDLHRAARLVLRDIAAELAATRPPSIGPASAER